MAQPKHEVIEYNGAPLEKASLESFAKAIMSGRCFPIPAHELLHGVAAFEAIVRSAATRRTVTVEATD
jgi:hypothetical protein